MGVGESDETDAASTKEERVRRSYRFLLEHEKSGTTFKRAELELASGWKPKTVGAYFSKKWSKIIAKEGDSYRVLKLSDFTEDEYVRMMSQKDEVSSDPKRPALPPNAEGLVRKARESAILALQVYNSPATVFKTEGFSVLMVIAWTALFHAIFEERGEPYFYTEDDGSPRLVDGDPKAWELDKCMAKLWGGADHAVRRNLLFFIRLRNQVEHRYVPAIDTHVAGECQALLLNFDELLVDKFGSYYAIRDSLAMPLQTAAVRNAGQAEVLRRLQARHFDDVMEFIDAYRSELPRDLHEDQRFSFRVFLVPRTGNHATSSDRAIEFVKHDPDKPELTADLQKQIAYVRERQVPVANANLLKPSDVVVKVAARLRNLSTRMRQRSWEFYEGRAAVAAASASRRGVLAAA